MKKTIIISFMLGLALITSATVGMVQAEEAQKKQAVSEFGDDVCRIMKDNPAGMINLLPLRYIMRVALASGFGDEQKLSQYLTEYGMKIDNLIDQVLADSGMLKEGAGAEYFGEKPVGRCSWAEPVEMKCEDMYISLVEQGLMNGTIVATFETLVKSASEQKLQGCATLHIDTEDESLYSALMMFDNKWYIVGDLTKPQ